MSEYSITPLRSTILALTKQDLWHITLGIISLILASYLVIPLKPVPITLQSTTAILLGAILGPRLAAYSIASYLALGFLSAPVFAPIAVKLGPTLGYLLGFMPAALLAGYMTQLGFRKNMFLTITMMLVCTTLLMISGYLVLSLYLGWKAAFYAGIMPFLWTESAKLIAAACLITKWRK